MTSTTEGRKGNRKERHMFGIQ